MILTRCTLGWAAFFLFAALPLAPWAKEAPTSPPASPPAVQPAPVASPAPAVPGQPSTTPTAPTPSSERKSAAPPEDSMRMYVLGLLYRGEKWTPEKTEETAKIQEAHLANIGRLAKEGKLILAGPFSGGDDLRGLFLFDVTTIEEARALAETDPAVQAGRLRVDLIQWYGPKGIRYDGMPVSN